MSDATLWAVALGVGVLGLVLVVTAGVAAVSANARARRSRVAPPVPEPQSQVAAAGADQAPDGGGWVWLKAGVFAFVHAGAVSFVLGGLTFFEDIARANEEIRTTGTVTFPKRLLPRALVGPDASLPLSRSSEERLVNAVGRANLRAAEPTRHDEPMAPEPDSVDWEVVDMQPEDAGGSGAAAQ